MFQLFLMREREFLEDIFATSGQLNQHLTAVLIRWSARTHLLNHQTIDQPYRAVMAKLQPRRDRIYWMHLHGYAWPEVDFSMACGRGTYVRAIARDLGLALQTGGCLSALRRTHVGPFAADDAGTLDRLEHATAAQVVLPLDTARQLIESATGIAPPRPASATAEVGGLS